MRTLLLSLILAALMPLCVRADKHDDDSGAAMALAKAKSQAIAAAKSKATTWALAKDESHRTGKPIFLRVGTADCGRLCQQLRPTIITAHEKAVNGLGDGLYLILPKDGHLWRCEQWAKVPSEKEVKEAVETWKQKLQPQSRAPVVYWTVPVCLT